MQIKVAARSSKLSRIQVQEIKQELSRFTDAIFDEKYVETRGDKDQATSLLDLDKTNFFTDIVDQLVLSGACDVGIHSAKDLPDPLDDGLEVFAFTKGKDPRDSLVFAHGKTFHSLGDSPRIGTSSNRRMDMARGLFKSPCFVDIRGTIEARLELLKEQKVDALIIAEAALIRLGLTQLNRVILNEAPAPMQGRLAVVGRKNDQTLKKLFKNLNQK